MTSKETQSHRFSFFQPPAVFQVGQTKGRVIFWTDFKLFHVCCFLASADIWLSKNRNLLLQEIEQPSADRINISEETSQSKTSLRDLAGLF